MREPESIPIHDLPSETARESADAGPTATERGLDFLAGIVSFGAGLVVSTLDGGDNGDERTAGVAAFVAAGAGLFLEGLRAAAPMLGSIERTAGPKIGSTGAGETVGELLDHWRSSWEDRNEDGVPLRRTLAFAHLGGATLDNEENYLMKKLYTAMGAVQIENQARI